MKKNLILVALMFLMAAPLVSFTGTKVSRSVTHKQMAQKKLTSTYIGDFYDGTYNYSVFVDPGTGLVSELYYDGGFGWVPVYYFSGGTWSSSNWYFINHLYYQRTSSSGSASFHGYLSI